MKLSLRDTIELLANLDFVVEKLRDSSGRPHKAEVLQALEPRLRKPYSSRQIDSRIKSLCGSADPKTVQDIYRYGSCRIKDLDADLKLKVQEELKIIKSEEVCIFVSTPRQLRSVSRHPATERSRSRRASTVFGERTPTRSAFRHHATESSRSKRGSANYSECTPTKTVRKTQGGELQARVSNFAENEPLSLEVRNRFES
jgi:hypothetical protein